MNKNADHLANRDRSVLALRSDVQAVAEGATAELRAEMAAKAIAHHHPPLKAEVLGDYDQAVQFACRRFLMHLKVGDVEQARHAAIGLDQLDQRVRSSKRLPQAWTTPSRSPLFETRASAEKQLPAQAPPVPAGGRRVLNVGAQPGAFTGVQHETRRLVEQQLLPTEVAIDGGSAKCRALDSEIIDVYMQRHGRSGGVNLLEADWMVTSHALYYLTPRVDSVKRWSWDDIQEVKKVGGGFLTSTCQIDIESGPSMRWKLAKSSAAALVGLSQQAL